MNMYITGTTIRDLRERKHMTQHQLAEALGVSDKTVSKWENAKGYPDITLIEPIAKAFGVSLPELLSGNQIQNANVSANMLRSKFYVCPVCGNVVHSMGEAVICCHGIQLMPSEAEPTDEEHMIFTERVEDHYISFIAALSSDSCRMTKLYPEGNAQARFKIDGVKRICFYCNRDGLFFHDVVKGIDDRKVGYDTTKEQKELEDTAKKLFG